MVNSAVRFQKDLTEAFEAVVTIISAVVEATNQKWPYIVVDKYEMFGSDFRQQGKLEILGFDPYVTHNQRSLWEEFTKGKYMIATENGHLLKYGNFSRLSRSGYHPYLGTLGPTGFQERAEADLYAGSP